MSEKPRVSYAESKNVLICRTGKKVGESISTLRPDFTIMDNFAKPGPCYTNRYRIYLNYPVGFRNIIMGMLCLTKPCFQVGELIMGEPCFEEVTEKRWFLKVYGKVYLENLMDMAEKLAEEYNVEIHVRLDSEIATKVEFESP